MIELVGTPFKEAFYTWLHTRHRTEKVAIAMEILEKMRADAHQREVEREDRREDHRDSMDMRA